MFSSFSLSLFLCLILKSLSVYSVTTVSYTLTTGQANVTTGPHTCCNNRNTNVTYYVDAVLARTSTTRTNFGSGFDARMLELNKLPGDEKGHILGSVFGGPAVTWNLAPQAANVNRRLNSQNSILVGWWECERWLQTSLESHQNLPVYVRVTLTYVNGNCRPTHWSISARNSNRRDPGCQALNIINGSAGPFAACSVKGG